MKKYFSTQRPVAPGSYPKKATVRVFNFDEKTYCPEIAWYAFGYITTKRELTEDEMSAYELIPEGMTMWYRVAEACYIRRDRELQREAGGGSRKLKTRAVLVELHDTKEAAEMAVENCRKA